MIPRATACRTTSRPATRSRTWRFLRRNPLAAFGLMIFSTWIILSIAAPIFVRYPPLKQNVTHRLQPPGEQFTFGSDQLGRDVQSRVFYAGRVSLPGGIMISTFAARFFIWLRTRWYQLAL